MFKNGKKKKKGAQEVNTTSKNHTEIPSKESSDHPQRGKFFFIAKVTLKHSHFNSFL